eukprot:1175357-Prorocentrum_minimum.AAC.1
MASGGGAGGGTGGPSHLRLQRLLRPDEPHEPLPLGGLCQHQPVPLALVGLVTPQLLQVHLAHVRRQEGHRLLRRVDGVRVVLDPAAGRRSLGKNDDEMTESRAPARSNRGTYSSLLCTAEPRATSRVVIVCNPRARGSERFRSQLPYLASPRRFRMKRAPRRERGGVASTDFEGRTLFVCTKEIRCDRRVTILVLVSSLI